MNWIVVLSVVIFVLWLVDTLRIGALKKEVKSQSWLAGHWSRSWKEASNYQATLYKKYAQACDRADELTRHLQAVGASSARWKQRWQDALGNVTSAREECDSAVRAQERLRDELNALRRSIRGCLSIGGVDGVHRAPSTGWEKPGSATTKEAPQVISIPQAVREKVTSPVRKVISFDKDSIGAPRLTDVEPAKWLEKPARGVPVHDDYNQAPFMPFHPVGLVW